MTNTMYDLVKRLEESLDDDREEILSSEYPEDWVAEVVDGTIPVYNYDLAIVLSEDLTLGFPEEIPFSPSDPDICIFKMIQWSISERLSSHASEWLEEAKRQEEEQAQPDRKQPSA